MVVGNSMEPRFFEGEVVTVHPYRPVRPNDYCVVQYKSEGEQLAVCKKFVSKNSDEITLTQHNPTKEIQIPAKDVHSVHYILSVQMV